MKKQTKFLLIGLVVFFLVLIGSIYTYINHLNYYEGYITQKMEQDEIWVVSATSSEEAMKKTRKIPK
ncbi:hypothetical protein CD798_04540 [Bacillaceae bacterium SAOS 7]|nr:hypothetical protein CD798_04540 [Bacillaceae bacterium SAOS 7]